MSKRVFIFSTAYFPLVGGAEVAMRELTNRLPGWDFQLICAAIKTGLPKTERIGNVTVHRCGFGHPIDKYLLPVLGLFRVHRIAKEGRPDVIWSLMASYGGFAALVCKWVYADAKMLLTLQEGDPLEHYDERAGLFSFFHKKIFQRADAVQALSCFLGEWAVKMGFRGTPEIIPNGVDIVRFSQRISDEERFHIRRKAGMSAEEIVLVTASRLSRKNGVDDLIRSLSHLPEPYKALIIGEGEDRAMLDHLTKELRLEHRVIFLGKRGHDELPGLLQASDIFVRASLSEGLGNAFLEAMAAGVPIIGTPVGGIPDFLTDGETGVFCAPRDPASIARAVLRITNEAGLRAKLIQQSETLVRERYDWSGIVARMDALLHRLAQ